MGIKQTARIDYTVDNGRGAVRKSKEVSASPANLPRVLEGAVAKLTDRGAYNIETRYVVEPKVDPAPEAVHARRRINTDGYLVGQAACGSTSHRTDDDANVTCPACLEGPIDDAVPPDARLSPREESKLVEFAEGGLTECALAALAAKGLVRFEVVGSLVVVVPTDRGREVARMAAAS